MEEKGGIVSVALFHHEGSSTTIAENDQWRARNSECITQLSEHQEQRLYKREAQYDHAQLPTTETSPVI